jgi:RpiR family carbohydrate utilization transcriptional regulator
MATHRGRPIPFFLDRLDGTAPAARDAVEPEEPELTQASESAGTARNFGPESGGSFFARLQEFRDQLRSSEAKVAEFIEANRERVAGMSIAELAAASETSEATVNRFSRALNYRGYGEMKLDVVRADAVGGRDALSVIKNIPSSIEATDDLTMVASKLVQSMAQGARDAAGAVNYEEVRRAIDTILSADRVYFYGIGGSGYVGDIAYHLFLKAGLVSSSCSDGYLQAVTSVLVTNRDVVIGISDSGVTRDVVSALRNARRCGAATIAMTGRRGTPIEEVADILLLTGSQQIPLYGDFLEARVSQLFIVDLLYIGVLLRDVPKYSRRIEGTAEAIRDRVIHRERDE